MARQDCLVRVIHKDKVELAKHHAMSDEQVFSLSRLFKAFSDPGRMKILYALSFQEMCVCDLAALLEISESAVSHQLRILRSNGLVENRREGTVLYYTIAVEGSLELITAAQNIMRDS